MMSYVDVNAIRNGLLVNKKWNSILEEEEVNKKEFYFIFYFFIYF
jgi:hypothetical protein